MKIINRLIFYWHRRNSQTFIKYLRKKGISVGKGTFAKFPLTIEIDTTRPELINIGSHVFLHKGLTIMSHDWASWVFIDKYNDFIPSHGKISIGNNVWFGENCTVLKGVTIGDNCIIGFGSVVTKDIPSNSVAVGIPAKVICTLDEYYEKRKIAYINEVFEYAQCIEEKRKREPQQPDFSDDYPIFVDGNNIQNYPNYPYQNVFTSKDIFNKWKNTHKAPFNSFEEFIEEYNRRKK